MPKVYPQHKTPETLEREIDALWHHLDRVVAGNIPGAARVVAAAPHTHLLAQIMDSGALAALNTVGTAEIDTAAVTTDKLINEAVTNPKLYRMPAMTLKANLATGSALPQDRSRDLFTTAVPASGDFAIGFLGAGFGDLRKFDFGAIDHDTLANWLAKKHVDHTLVSVIAGTALTGGGDISANRTLNVDKSAIDLADLGGKELADLDDVIISGPIGTGQVLRSSADYWVNTADPWMMEALFTAKGDLLGASAANTPVELNVGEDGDVLFADSGEETGLRWGALLARIAGSTYSTVQHLQDLFHSSGWVSGGAVTDAGGETVDVAAGTGLIRATDSRVAEILFFDWPASLAVAIPTDTTRWIGIEYNAGSPQVVVKTSHASFDFQSDFPVAKVVNEAGTLHLQAAQQAVGDHAAQMILRMHGTMPLQRDERLGGLIIGETGTRNVTFSAGALWDDLNYFPIAAIDTSGADRVETYYVNSGTWTRTGSVSQWPNTQYNDIALGLVTMSNNRYANGWWYIEPDGELVMVYGQAQFVSSSQAENEQPPSTLPERITEHAKFIGRLLFKKSEATATQIDTIYETVFVPTQASDHVNLANKGTHTHAEIDAHIDDLATRRATRIFYIEDPEAGMEFPQHFIEDAITVSEVHGVTDTGTIKFNIERRGKTTPDQAGTDIIDDDPGVDPDLTIDATGKNTTSFAASGAVAADQWLVVTITAVASTPTKGWICLQGTID